MSETSHDRWYDKDIALSRALDSLKKASDSYQAEVALNIIKIVVEHRLESLSGVFAEKDALAQLMEEARTERERTQSRRWYDVNETLSSAMILLRDTPEEVQSQIIPSIARMIEQTLQTVH